MLYDNIECLWDLMSKYIFKVKVTDSLNNNLTCIICQRLMIDPCQSSCGCQYCYSCIIGYLSNEDKYCPGKKSECHDEYLVLGKNVTKNIRMSKQLFKLKVHCPHELCEYEEELGHIDEHMRVCQKQTIKCPYVILGCENEEASKDVITSHLYDEAFKHSDVLIKCFLNLQNELNTIKEEFRVCKNEMVLMKEESFRKEVLVKEQESVIMLMKSEYINDKLKIDELQKEINLIKEGSMKMEQKVGGLTENLNIRELMEKSKNNEIELKDLRKEMKVFKDTFKKNEVILSNISQIEDEIKSIKEVNNERKKCDEERDIEINTLYKFSLNADFVWKISEISKKMQTIKFQSIFSEAFYCYEYKLCLNMCIYNDEGDFYLGCVIMKGENDDRIEWPMTKEIILSIGDPDSLKSVTFTYDSYEHKTAFDRPQNEMNDNYIGQYPFISSLIKDMKNDFLVISCVVSKL